MWAAAASAQELHHQNQQVNVPVSRPFFQMMPRDVFLNAFSTLWATSQSMAMRVVVHTNRQHVLAWELLPCSCAQSQFSNSQDCGGTCVGVTLMLVGMLMFGPCGSSLRASLNCAACSCSGRVAE